MLLSLNTSYYGLGQYLQAIDYLQQSLTIVQEIGSRNGEGTVLGNLGLAYGLLGDYSQASTISNKV